MNFLKGRTLYILQLLQSKCRELFKTILFIDVYFALLLKNLTFRIFMKCLYQQAIAKMFTNLYIHGYCNVFNIYNL